MVDIAPKGLFSNTSHQFQNVDLDVLDDGKLIFNVKQAVSYIPTDVFINFLRVTLTLTHLQKSSVMVMIIFLIQQKI